MTTPPPSGPPPASEARRYRLPRNESPVWDEDTICRDATSRPHAQREAAIRSVPARRCAHTPMPRRAVAALVKAANWLSHLEFDWNSRLAPLGHGTLPDRNFVALRRTRMRAFELGLRNCRSTPGWRDLETVVDALVWNSSRCRHLARRAHRDRLRGRHPERVSTICTAATHAAVAAQRYAAAAQEAE